MLGNEYKHLVQVQISFDEFGLHHEVSVSVLLPLLPNFKSSEISVSVLLVLMDVSKDSVVQQLLVPVVLMSDLR